MFKKKKSFGKELNNVISFSNENLANIGVASETKLKNVGFQNIVPGKYQPRRVFNKKTLNDLADSIKEKGIIQPIIVRENNKGKYEIIAGERRWRAAQIARLEKIPIIVSNVSDETVLAFSLIENIQRENLNALEEALAYQRLINEFGLTHNQVAKNVGKSRASISNFLRLLKLEKAVKELLHQGKLEMGHARALLGLQGEKQGRAAQEIINKNLSVRETEKLVQKFNEPIVVREKLKTDLENKRAGWVDKLSNKLATKISITMNNKGKGRVIINFESPDEVDWLVDRIES